MAASFQVPVCAFLARALQPCGAYIEAASDRHHEQVRLDHPGQSLCLAQVRGRDVAGCVDIRVVAAEYIPS